MKSVYSLKRWLKNGRWQARRAATYLRWGHERFQAAPAVLGNAMPKSGSHLIIQVLQGLTRLGPFVNPGFPPVNRGEDNAELPDQAVLANLLRLRPGDIAYGYVHARPPFIDAIVRPGMACVFVYRDPRDMIISHIFYATEIHPGHGMHPYYTQTLETMEQRIQAAILGVDQPGSEMSSVKQRYANYLGWLEQPAVLCLRFEDLIENRQAAFGQLLDYLDSRGFNPQPARQQAISVLETAIAPKRSGTFRKGQPGNWREHFNEANRELFKEHANDLLVSLGYETDANW